MSQSLQWSKVRPGFSLCWYSGADSSSALCLLLWLLPNLGFSWLFGTVVTGSPCLTRLVLLVTASNISDSKQDRSRELVKWMRLGWQGNFHLLFLFFQSSFFFFFLEPHEDLKALIKWKSGNVPDLAPFTQIKCKDLSYIGWHKSPIFILYWCHKATKQGASAHQKKH